MARNSLTAFESAVLRMREAQRRLFEERTLSAHHAALEAERTVDLMLERKTGTMSEYVEREIHGHAGGSLFGPG